MRTTLKHPKDFCGGCPLNRAKNKICHYIPTDVYYDRIDSEGKPQVDILIVGDAPGKAEDESGMPFTGASGGELHAALKAAGISGSVDDGSTVGAAGGIPKRSSTVFWTGGASPNGSADGCFSAGIAPNGSVDGSFTAGASPKISSVGFFGSSTTGGITGMGGTGT